MNTIAVLLHRSPSTPAVPGSVDGDGFRKSSWSVWNPANRFCVAVKMEGDSVMVRDTKDPKKTTLTYTRAEWDAFIRGVKAGEFDL
ncbi:MAG TPA: DUF397 domain-containing protein [Candidatus Paceibacterota bacterium]|nr:DUF397 domain-containing protein [Candidatus Paceibacterota bacterium]